MRTKFVHLYIYIYECTWIGNCIETVPCHTRLHNGTKCRTVVFLLLARQLAGTSTCIFIHKNKRLGWVHLIVRAAQQTELTCIAHTIFQAHRAPHFSLAHTHTHTLTGNEATAKIGGVVAKKDVTDNMEYYVRKLLLCTPNIRYI